MIISLIFSSFLSYAQQAPGETQPSIDRSAVRSVISKSKKSIKKCYTQIKEPKKSKIKGKLLLEWWVTEKGNVKAVDVIQPLNKDLDRCIAKNIKKLKFPKAESGSVYRVEYPFVFSSNTTAIKDTTPVKVDIAAAKEAIRNKRPEIRDCFTQHKTKSGTVTVEWTVNDKGEVTKTKIIKKLEKPAEKCITSLIKSMTFPKAPKGITYNLEYPFSFKSAR